MPSALGLIALAFTFGIACGEWLALSVPAALLLTGAVLLTLGLARRREHAVGLAALGVALALGGLATAGARPRPPAELFDERCTIEGRVAFAPERTATGLRLPVDLRAIERDGRRQTAGDRILLLLQGSPLEPLLPGDLVRATVRLHRPRGFLNPGAADAARRSAAVGVVAVAGLRAPALSRLIEPPVKGVARAVMAWRALLRTEVGRHLRGSARSLVASLVLGDRGDVPPALEEAFRDAGVAHVLSVSGLHLAIAAFLFYVGLRRLLVRWSRLARAHSVQRLAAVAALPAVVVYTLVTGAQVATVRACVVALVWLTAVALCRRTTALQALAVASLLILSASPLMLFDPSFQLSFAAAAGTATLAMRGSPPALGRTLSGRLFRWAARLIISSAAAIAVTAPIGAWFFAQLSLGGLVSNLIVVPLAELGVVPVGLAGAVLGAWGVPGAGHLLRLAGALADLMAAFTLLFAKWVPAWHVPAPNLVELVAWYGALVALAVAGRRGGRVVFGAALLVCGSVAWRLAERAWGRTLTATFLDVGQGDACVVELPHGHVIVIDGGGGTFDPDFDPGRLVVAPFLWRRGIGHIDLVILSHPHPDHANGLPYLIEHFAVGAVWTNHEPTRQSGTVSLLAAAARRHVPVPSPRSLQLGGAAVVPLAPLDGGGRLAVDPARGENDNSLVIAVSYAGRRLLFTGDLEADGEAALLARVETLGATVVKVPHHGSRTSSTPELVAATRPQLAVISVGGNNRWGFPHPTVVARWRGVGARVLRTDQGGAITVTVDRAGAVAASALFEGE